MAGWRARDIPDLTGRTAVVTGANSGIGFVTARALARAGAHVVLGCRDEGRGAAAVRRVIRSGAAAERVSLVPLDLADLASVSRFAGDCASRGSVDILVNNAGVMAWPRRSTVDGFESHFGINQLGHFALTAALMPLLMAASAPRVISLTSLFAAFGLIDFDNLNGEKYYFRWLAYAQSKLAILLFADELARRAAAAGSPLRSLAAHPGYSATHLLVGGPRRGPAIEARLLGLTSMIFAQSARMGALPSLYAATHPSARNGALIGPPWWLGQFRGYPREVSQPLIAPIDRRPEIAAHLWHESERLTGRTFPALRPDAASSAVDASAKFKNATASVSVENVKAEK